jgi:hypothetical protein
VYTCRECEHLINQATEICPYCGADLTEPPAGEAEQPGSKHGLASTLLRWTVLLGTLAAALWGFLWFVLPERGVNPAGRAEAQAIETLGEVRAALATYAGAQAGSYPPSLEVLEDRVRAPAQRALSGGYQLQYTPGPVANDGGVHSYVLLARPGNYSYRSFFMDETGVVRATRENRPATAQDPPI